MRGAVRWREGGTGMASLARSLPLPEESEDTAATLSLQNLGPRTRVNSSITGEIAGMPVSRPVPGGWWTLRKYCRGTMPGTAGHTLGQEIRVNSAHVGLVFQWGGGEE